MKNRFAVGDKLEVIHPSGNRVIELAEMTRNGESVQVAPGNGMQVRIPGLAGYDGKALITRLL